MALLETLKSSASKHGKKAIGTVATSSVAGLVAWAMTTFCTKSEHHDTRMEIQALREHVAVLMYQSEHQTTKGQP